MFLVIFLYMVSDVTLIFCTCLLLKTTKQKNAVQTDKWSTYNEHVFNFWIKIYFYVFVGHEVKHVGGTMKKKSHQKAENLNKMTLE